MLIPFGFEHETRVGCHCRLADSPGSDFGIAWAIAVDSSGDVYVFGTTNSADFPVTPGALQTTLQVQSQQQGFVAKLDPNGKIVYSTFIGGAAYVNPGLALAPGLHSILVDSASDAIITGGAGTNSGTGTFPPANGAFPLALNPDGSINACLNPAPAGSIVTLFLDGLGVTSPSQTTGVITANPAPSLSSPVITANGGVTVVSVSAPPGAISGVWQVNLRIPANEPAGGNQVSLSASGTPVRDANLIAWVE